MLAVAGGTQAAIGGVAIASDVAVTLDEFRASGSSLLAYLSIEVLPEAPQGEAWTPIGHLEFDGRRIDLAAVRDGEDGTLIASAVEGLDDPAGDWKLVIDELVGHNGQWPENEQIRISGPWVFEFEVPGGWTELVSVQSGSAEQACRSRPKPTSRSRSTRGRSRRPRRLAEPLGSRCSGGRARTPRVADVAASAARRHGLRWLRHTSIARHAARIASDTPAGTTTRRLVPAGSSPLAPTLTPSVLGLIWHAAQAIALQRGDLRRGQALQHFGLSPDLDIVRVFDGPSADIGHHGLCLVGGAGARHALKQSFPVGLVHPVSLPRQLSERRALIVIVSTA
jgi:hypothetical protein